MSDVKILLDADDVTVVPIPVNECECGQAVASHVRLDMRNNGQSTVVYEGCAACAENFARRLRESLDLCPGTRVPGHRGRP